ncbi:MAG TPA: O-antigen ligase family protein [Anaerolineae bacterium]|nr:O-antigen ligase family protein [Anaerolineae bacterium]
MMPRLRALARPVATVEIWPVALLLAASVVSTAALPIALAVAALFWPIRWLAYGHLTLRSAADWPAGLLLLTLPVTLWATALPAVTQTEVLRLLAGLALYYAIVNWVGHGDARRPLRWLATGLVAAGLGLALAAPFTVEWIVVGKLLFIPETLYRRLPLLLADPIHPNVMAGALGLLLPLALALPLFAWRELRWFERLLTLAAALAMLGILLISKSRGGLLAFGAVLILLAALRWRRGWLLAPAAILAAGIALWSVGPGWVIEALTATQALGGLDGRLEVWSRGLYMAQDFPFTGIGMGTFRQVANAMYPFFLAGPDADIPHAHNLLLQVAVDQGLPGLVMWLALLLLVICGAWSVYRRGQRAGDRRLTALGAGLLCSQAALVVHGLLDATVWGTRPAVLAWAVWGLAMAAWNWAATSPRVRI